VNVAVLLVSVDPFGGLVIAALSMVAAVYVAVSCTVQRPFA
jgi:hypothetical protein